MINGTDSRNLRVRATLRPRRPVSSRRVSCYYLPATTMVPLPEKFTCSLARRSSLRASDTDCLRLIDGAGDGFPDLLLDDFAGRWLAQTRGGDLPPWLATAPGFRSLYW